MPSFDIASKVDLQTLDNAINVVKKEIQNRFDFRGSHFEMELDKKNFIIKVEAESDMKIQQVTDVILSRGIKQGIDANAFDFSKEAYPSGKVVKQEVSIKNGLKQDDANLPNLLHLLCLQVHLKWANQPLHHFHQALLQFLCWGLPHFLYLNDHDQ